MNPSAPDASRDNSPDTSRIAFIQSNWHADIVGQGRESFLAACTGLGFARERVDIFTVPGAFEIPLHAKILAHSGRYVAIVGCGFVVDGGIYRHEFVAQAVIDGLMRVQLDTEIPVFSVVLTPHRFHDHAAHQSFFFEHMLSKGAEAAHACAQTIASLSAIRASTRPLRKAG